MALPFTREFLTVAMPDDCVIRPEIFVRARRLGVRVSRVPLSLFPPAQIERLTTCHMVPALAAEPEMLYSESVEQAIGESQRKNSDIVPPEWLRFGETG
jgi:hypothetical protein